jgi:UDP-glucose 4-epimerase
MKCLILGGAGFIGSHLCERLLLEGHDVRVFDRQRKVSDRVPVDPRIEWIDGDFLNADDLEVALKGIEVLFHLVSATLPKSSNANPIYDVETNIIGTLRLLDIAKNNNVQKVIFTSSGGTVYGPPKFLPISEVHPTEPIVSYGITKLAIEKYLQMYKALYSLDYCILRLANPYGARQRVDTAQGAVAVFLDRALNNDTIHVWGDGSVIRDYIYIGDVVDSLVKAMFYKGDIHTFNIGSGKGLSLNEILEELHMLLGRKPSVQYEYGRSFDVPVNILDISAAKNFLKWQPITSFSKGLRLTLDGKEYGQT